MISAETVQSMDARKNTMETRCPFQESHCAPNIKLSRIVASFATEITHTEHMVTRQAAAGIFGGFPPSPYASSYGMYISHLSP